MRMIEVRMERRRNKRVGDTGYRRENPPNSGIPTCENTVTRGGIELGSPWRALVTCRGIKTCFGHLGHRTTAPADTNGDLIQCTDSEKFHKHIAVRLACSPPTKAIRVQFPAGSLLEIVPDDATGRRDFPGNLPPPPPLHSGALSYSPQSPPSALKTSLLRSAKIYSLTLHHIVGKVIVLWGGEYTRLEGKGLADILPPGLAFARDSTDSHDVCDGAGGVLYIARGIVRQRRRRHGVVAAAAMYNLEPRTWRLPRDVTSRSAVTGATCACACRLTHSLARTRPNTVADGQQSRMRHCRRRTDHCKWRKRSRVSTPSGLQQQRPKSKKIHTFRQTASGMRRRGLLLSPSTNRAFIHWQHHLTHCSDNFHVAKLNLLIGWPILHSQLYPKRAGMAAGFFVCLVDYMRAIHISVLDTGKPGRAQSRKDGFKKTHFKTLQHRTTDFNSGTQVPDTELLNNLIPILLRVKSFPGLWQPTLIETQPSTLFTETNISSSAVHDQRLRPHDRLISRWLCKPSLRVQTLNCFPAITNIVNEVVVTDRSPPTMAIRVQSPAGSPDFRMWKSCRTMPLVGGFSRGSPVSPAL
ncbi:hypothetical protein PR048_016679 [Dryococelus australis]|uniref:Uncharacterized protein n=1 Tax=Dryococelus australis TaxID=614101 RepID=A0ABQ9H7G4_9NEOP|nr:hypothetical protein PR048_016679 [Dryococelus australis]